MEGEIAAPLKPLSWLIGTWESSNGAGTFPTIKDFKYKDVIEFRQCGAQPLLAYSGWSSHPEKGNPMHLESGFLRSKGNNQLSFMVAHNFGLTSLEEGNVDDKEIKLQTTPNGICRMSGAKDPSVVEIKRTLSLQDENTLVQRLWMKTSSVSELTHHLEATYKRKQ